MSSEISSPLSEIIKKAAQNTKPGRHSAATAAMRRRFENASSAVFLLIDVSSSKASFIGNVGMTKYEAAVYAARDVVRNMPYIRVVVFGLTHPNEVAEITDLRNFPLPMGDTPLAEALEMVAKSNPVKTIIICDGEPNDRVRAEQVADGMTGAIDTIYCGPENSPSHLWLRSLARRCAGRDVVWNGVGELAGSVRLLLPAPESA